MPVKNYRKNAEGNLELQYTVPTEQDVADNYVLKKGDTMTGTLNVPTINNYNVSTAVSIATGTHADSYFQSKKFRGQGNAGTYNHAIDFGYSGHDRVDFYEYGGIWNFWMNNQSTAVTDKATKLALTIGLDSLSNKSYTYTWPNKTGTFALTSDLDAKQDSLTAGDNITITDATISAKDTTYSIDTATGNTLTLTGSDGTSLTKTIDDVAHATSAGSATKATQDASGNVIASTYATATALSAVENKIILPKTMTSWTWGTLTTSNGYTQLGDYDESGGGSFAVAAKGGQISVQIDGRFYDQEGKYRLVDTNDIATVATSGSYNDLTDKPTIPAAITIDSALSSSSTNPVQNKVINSALSGKQSTLSSTNKLSTDYISGLATVATTGKYSDLTGTPTIPAAVTVDSALSSTSTNPVQNKIVKAALDGKQAAGSYAAASHTHTTSEITDFPTIPTKVSQLTNDSGYTTNTGTITGIKMNGASKGTSGVVDLGTVLTAHQSLSGYATETWVNNKGYTTNTGTVTSVAVKMNGSTKGTVTSSGTIDLGTVLTAHQSLCISTTYANLKSLRDAGTLTPGATYRITDYEFTTTQAGSSSAGHGFDILVIADDAKTLNENARAIARSGDTYYSDSGSFPSDLSAWELKYCINNDLSRFSWADTTNGKGVIYYLKDDRGNIAPYDHKNCLFTRYKVTNSIAALSSLSGQYLGTTSGVSTGLTKGTDTKTYLTFDRYCYDNRIEPYRTSVTVDGTAYADTAKLNDITICVYSQDRTNTTNHLYGNTFEANCHDITVAPIYSWPVCYYNSFGNGCYSNSSGGNFYYNSFGSNCYYNSFGSDCSSNSFGNNCYSNSFGSYYNRNSFGDACYSNSFSSGCNSNSFGGNCYSNSFGSFCNYNSFGGNCYYNYLCSSKISSTYINYARYNAFENGVSYVSLYNSSATGSSSAYLQNVHIHEGVSGTSSSRKVISVGRNLAYGTDIYAEGHVTMTA